MTLNKELAQLILDDIVGGQVFIIMDIQESHLLLKHSVTQMEEKIHMEGKEFLHRCHRWTWGNMLIQDAFPTLASHEREFLISGYNKEAWDKMAAEYDEVLEEMEKEDG